jgi:hypothetical protein
LVYVGVNYNRQLVDGKMSVDNTGIVHLVLTGLTDYVFGNMAVTATILLLIFVIFAVLINIPLPFALAIPIPFAVMLIAYGYLTVLVGGLLAGTFLILAVASFLAGMGVRD